MIIDWIQHPVGHGGFHSAIAQSDEGATFSWVFDCGSRKKDLIESYLKRWTRTCGQSIDWLFISHFDTDHANGVDMLMSRANVRDVMVPYVNDQELAYLLLREIGRGNLDRWLFELVADPATFFLSRGADRVTFLGGPPDGPISEDGMPWRSGPDDDQTQWTQKISPAPAKRPSLVRSRVRPAANSRLNHINNQTCDIHVRRGASGLLLKPYRAPIGASSLGNLIKRLTGLVRKASTLRGKPGLGDLAYAIANFARTAEGRLDLRSVFKEFVGSSNRASLSLLSIPIIRNDPSRDVYWRFRSRRYWDRGDGVAAWVSTGDAELLRQQDLDDWHEHYSQHIPSVRVAALPHHGSDRNSDLKFQKLFPEAVFTAHAKKGAAKHPGDRVTSIAGNRLVSVTERPKSTAALHVRIEK